MRMRFGTFDNLQDRRDNAPKVPNTFFLVSSCLFYLRFLSIDPKGFFHGSHPPGLFSFSLLPLLLLLFFAMGYILLALHDNHTGPVRPPPSQPLLSQHT